jgi:broad specificity phosphatase PhoE
MTKRKLILIRHSQSLMIPDQPASSWPLTTEGRARCLPLAQKLTPYQLPRIITSTEIKAIETGRIIADHLQIPCAIASGLHEHESDDKFQSRQAFLAAVNRLFAEPDRPVFGQSAHAALARFQQAIKDVCACYPVDNLAVVTHGRVLALFLAALTEEPAVKIWPALKMPDYRIVSIYS